MVTIVVAVLSAVISSNKRMEELSKRIGDLRADMMRNFQLIDNRFDAIDRRFDATDRRLERIEAKLDGHEVRIATLEERTSPLGRR